MKMKKETEKQIHRIYNDVVNLPYYKVDWQICQEFAEELEKYNPTSAKDAEIVDFFINKLYSTSAARKDVVERKHLCSDMKTYSRAVVRYMNSKFKEDLDFHCFSRKKALEGDLAKSLKLSDQLRPEPIFDRFGVRMILMDGGLKKLFSTIRFVLSILCGLNRKERRSFLEFLEKDKELREPDRERIKLLLEIPFIMETIQPEKDTAGFRKEDYPNLILPTKEELKILDPFSGMLKNYIEHPKADSGYQSVHVVVSVDPSYQYLPGFHVEFQFRTWQMHCHAELDKANHHDYKIQSSGEYSDIIKMDNPDRAWIKGFAGYEKMETDLYGIHFHEII